jgi:hypothetical protein
MSQYKLELRRATSPIPLAFCWKVTVALKCSSEVLEGVASVIDRPLTEETRAAADYPDTCGGRSIELPAARSDRRYGTRVAITAITNTSIKMCIASGAR